MNRHIGEKITSIPGKEEIQQNKSEDWNFECDVNYLFMLDSYYGEGGSQLYIRGRTFAIIEGKVTTQPDQLISGPFSFRHLSGHKVDAILGNFDITKPNELLLSQVDDTISLSEVDISSVKKYRTIFTEKTNFFTKSKACNILNIEAKEQIVTVLFSEKQIGLDVYYFDNGKKVEWGKSQLFDHGIGLPYIETFDVSVSEVLPNKTVEVIVVVCNSSNISTLGSGSFQNNLIRLVIDVSSKTFSLAANQKFGAFEDNFLCHYSISYQIFQSNGFVYLNYMNASHTHKIAALELKGTNYDPIWEETYPRCDHTQTVFYKHNDVFYFVHESSDGETIAPNVEIYQQQKNGTLHKNKSIKLLNKTDSSVFSRLGCFYTNNSLYLVKITHSNNKFQRIFYYVDEKKDKLDEISRTDVTPVEPLLCFPENMPIIVVSNYNIKARTPNITSLTESYNVVAILDAPPISSLIDYPNPDLHPSITYSFQKQQASTNSLTTKTEREQSKSLGASLSLFGAEIGADISKIVKDSAEKNYVNQLDTTINKSINTQKQDIVVYLGVTYDIYEYPITIGKSTDPIGNFLFIVPTSSLHSNSDAGRLMFRKTSHQVGNLMSYLTEEPTDVKKMLYTSQSGINSDQSIIETLTSKDLNMSGGSVTMITTLNRSLHMGAEFPIIGSLAGKVKAEIGDRYDDTTINISSFTIENSFTLTLEFHKNQEHDSNKYFNVQPYFYIDSNDILRCSYRVDVPSGSHTVPTFWKDYYDCPDFGMVMPFHEAAFEDDSKYLLSFDIETSPSDYVKDLKELEIKATIHNWSLVSGENVDVGFYYMKKFKKNPSPNDPDLIEIGRTNIAVIRPRQSQVTSFKWKNPTLDKEFDAVPIFAIIDPDNNKKVKTRDNNFAMMIYPINSIKPRTGIEHFFTENAEINKSSTGYEPLSTSTNRTPIAAKKS